MTDRATPFLLLTPVALMIGFASAAPMAPPPAVEPVQVVEVQKSDELPKPEVLARK